MPIVALWVCAGIRICLEKLAFASQTIMHLVKTHARAVQFNNGITLTGNTCDEPWEKLKLWSGDVREPSTPVRCFIKLLSKADGNGSVTCFFFTKGSLHEFNYCNVRWHSDPIAHHDLV